MLLASERAHLNKKDDGRFGETPTRNAMVVSSPVYFGGLRRHKGVSMTITRIRKRCLFEGYGFQSGAWCDGAECLYSPNSNLGYGALP